MAVGVAAQAMLGGMPESRELRRTEVDGQVLITVGATVIAGYQADDAVMRNITAVALTGLGFSGRRVGELLGITEQYVSMLRGRARRQLTTQLLLLQASRLTRCRATFFTVTS